MNPMNAPRLLPMLAALACLASATACQSESTSAPTETTSTSASSSSSSAPSMHIDSDARVWIARPDGSKSCEDGGTALGADQDKLKSAGIEVYSSTKGDDGLMHAQMCGADTGKENRYLIPQDKLPDAIKLGFRQVADSKKE